MSRIDALPPLGDVLRNHGLVAKKSLGQNFLLDLNLTSKIARAAGELQGVHVVEIGPGPGGLTRAILANGADHITVIERDSRCLEALDQISDHYPDKMTIIEGDALETDYASLAPADKPVKLIANLPYNVATPLLVNWVKTEPWPPWYRSTTLMFQREVAERIVARPSDKHYGRIGVLCGWRMNATIMFDVPPQAFTPPPKVTSSIVHFEPREVPLKCHSEALEKVTGAAFGQRRKMLRQSLKSVFQDPSSALEAVGLDPTARAETISIKGFVDLANRIRAD
ncbi:MAG: 16S rRNA (adenine(1518)-N(6)/adenine(1519)-N(6))-dimethyltransferase RsmA [Pseudomonadota bacterium]